MTGKYAAAIAASLAVVFLVQGLWGSLSKSLTWDEPTFIAAGYAHLTRSGLQIHTSHPPLMKGLEAFPLLFMNLRMPVEDDSRWRESAYPAVTFAHQFFAVNAGQVRRIAFWARLPVLGMGLGLILAMFLWGRRLYGPQAALLGTAAATFSPNLIAHAKVATEDLGCAALMFVAVWTFWRATREDRLQDWIVAGVATGFALLAKYTSLLLGPIFLLLGCAVWLSSRTRIRPVSMIKGFAIIGGIAGLLIGAGYNLSFDYSRYLRGIATIYTDLQPDHSFYLLGQVSTQPWWYYHLVAFVLKVPVPVLILIGLAAIRAVRGREHREATLFLLIPAMLVLVVSCFDRENLGLRRILPAFPFLFLFVAQALAGERRRWAKLVIVVLLAWTAIEAARIFPHHLSYFNTIAGGAQRGPYLLDDSNIDWGQDLPGLAAWQAAHPAARPLNLMYFGTAIPESYGVEALAMRNRDILHPRPGTYAISAHMLVWFRKIQTRFDDDVDWLTRYEPIGRAGHSIYIYEFSAPDSAGP